MYDHPRLKEEVDKVISSNPFNDVAILNWVVFLGVMLSNAFTNIYRGNLTNTAKRSSSLHSVLDTYANSRKVKPQVEVAINAS